MRQCTPGEAQHAAVVLGEESEDSREPTGITDQHHIKCVAILSSKQQRLEFGEALECAQIARGSSGTLEMILAQQRNDVPVLDRRALRDQIVDIPIACKFVGQAAERDVDNLPQADRPSLIRSSAMRKSSSVSMSTARSAVISTVRTRPSNKPLRVMTNSGLVTYPTGVMS